MLLIANRCITCMLCTLLLSSCMVNKTCGYERIFSCDFEDGSGCAITQWEYPLDNFDWTRWRGPSGGAYSGPNSDHTYGNISGNYMYTQSNIERRGEKAILQIGERLQLKSAGRGLLRFYYHMHDFGGEDELADLKVYACHRDGSALNPPSWSQSTRSQGNSWLMAEIVYECHGEFQVLFEGVRGTRESDIAIDDVQLFDLSTDETVPYASTSAIMVTKTVDHSLTVDRSDVPAHLTTNASLTDEGTRFLEDSTVTSFYISQSLIHDMETSNQEHASKKKMILLIALTAPMFSVILLLIVLAFVCYIRKRKRKGLEVSSSASVDGAINPYIYDRGGYVELQGPVASIYTKLQVACTGISDVNTSAYMTLQNTSTASSFKRITLPYNSNTVPAPVKSNDPPVYMDPEQLRRHSKRHIGANPTYGMEVATQVAYYHIPDVISQANYKDQDAKYVQYPEYYVLEKEENHIHQDELESYQADDEEEFTSETPPNRFEAETDSYLDLCIPDEETIDSIRLSDYQADASDSDDYHFLGPNDLGFSCYQTNSELNNLSAPTRTIIENTVDYTHV